MPIIERIRKGLSVFKISKGTTLKYLSLILIFIIGFLIRAFPVIEYGYNIRAYDPYVQFATAEYIREYGLKAFFRLFDTQVWAPKGRGLGKFYIGVGGVGALFHFIITSLGIEVDFLTVIALVPPLFGALSALAVYGTVSDLSNDRAALFSAFVAAISMGLIRRSLVGFFDNDATGVFYILMSLWMFIRGIKKKSPVYSFFSGVFLALLAWTWGASKYLFGLYALFAFLLLLTGKIDTNTGMNYSITVLIGVGLRVILPANYGSVTDTVVLASLGMIALIVLYFGAIYVAEFTSLEKEQTFHWVVGSTIAIGIITVAVLYSTGRLGGVGTKYISILDPTVRDELPAFSSVSENQPAAWSSIFRGVFLPIIFTPLGVYYFFENRTKRGGFFVLCMFTAFYFASSISRLVVMFSPFFAMAAGVGIDFLLTPLTAVLKREWLLHKVRPVRRRLGELTLPRGEAIIGYVLVALTLFLTVYHTRQNVKNPSFQQYDLSDGEKNVFQYLRTHASSNDRVAAWWDYGYRIRYRGHVTTLVDNFTSNYHAMGTVGAMLMLSPKKSIEIMRKYRVKYMIAYKVDIQKAQWMIKISSKHASEWGVEKDQWYDSDSQKYKKPFFTSTLWKLIGAQMDRETSFIKRLGVKGLEDQASQFKVEPKDLKFFKTVETGNNIYLYKVLYRTPINDLPSIN